MTHGEKGHNIHIKINLCFDLFCSHRHDDFGPKRQQSNADHQFIFSLAVAICCKTNLTGSSGENGKFILLQNKMKDHLPLSKFWDFFFTWFGITLKALKYIILFSCDCLLFGYLAHLCSIYIQQKLKLRENYIILPWRLFGKGGRNMEEKNKLNQTKDEPNSCCHVIGGMKKVKLIQQKSSISWWNNFCVVCSRKPPSSHEQKFGFEFQ